MTRRDEVIRMARATGWDFGWEMTVEQVYEFADLVSAAERERCANVCEALGQTLEVDESEHYAEEIRALKDEASE